MLYDVLLQTKLHGGFVPLEVMSFLVCFVSILRESLATAFWSRFLCLRQHRGGILIKMLFFLILSGEILGEISLQSIVARLVGIWNANIIASFSISSVNYLKWCNKCFFSSQEWDWVHLLFLGGKKTQYVNKCYHFISVYVVNVIAKGQRV